jgi:two-component system, NtrC family, sensor kinase
MKPLPAICLLILAIIPVLIMAQDPKRQRDSLFRIISAQTKQEKINTLMAIGKSYWNINNDSAFLYVDSARILSEKYRDLKGRAESNRIIGVTNLYRWKGMGEIKPYLDTALLLYKTIGNQKGLADTYNNLGSLYKYVNNKKASLEFYDSSLVLYRKLGDKKGEAAVLNYIGIVYQGMGEFRKAIDFTLQGLVVREKTDDHLGIIFSYLNVGNIFLAGGQPDMAIRYYQQGLDYATRQNIKPPVMAYNEMGKAYLKLGDLTKAGEYLLPSSGKIINSYPDKLLLGSLYLAMDKLDSAAFYFGEVAIQSEKNSDTDNLSQALLGLSKIFIKQGNLEKAFELSKSSYRLTGTVNKIIHAESAGLLAELYEKKGRLADAYIYLKEQHGILDSIINSNYQNKLAYFESRADLDKLETRMQALSVQKVLQEKLYQQEKNLRNYLIGISVLILVSAFFVIRNINAKRKKIQSQNILLDEQRKNVEKSYHDLQSAQSQLIQSEKMASLGELTAGIAHEIQNPLNFVNNFSEINTELSEEVLEAAKKGDLEQISQLVADMRSNQVKISEHGKRADAIVKGMLQHSRSSSGIKEPTDINNLADEYLRLSYHGFRTKDKAFHATLQTYFDPEIGKILIIPQDIGRVLLNLYNNAFYAVNEKQKGPPPGYEPSVWLQTKKVGEIMEITVRDNGNGIPAKVLDKVFQPFFTTKPTGQGTGLGLSLSYDIIKAHQGNINIRNTPGEGAEFIITLPIHA